MGSLIRYPFLATTVRERFDATRPGESYLEQSFPFPSGARLLGVDVDGMTPAAAHVEALLRTGVNMYPGHLQGGFLMPLPIADLMQLGAPIPVPPGHVVALQLHNLGDAPVELQLVAVLEVADDEAALVSVGEAALDPEIGFDITDREEEP